MGRKPSLEQQKKNREQDAWLLFYKHKIDMPEYKRLLDLIRSPDEENLCVAVAIIKAKFKKPKKNKDGNKS